MACALSRSKVFQRRSVCLSISSTMILLFFRAFVCFRHAVHIIRMYYFEVRNTIYESSVPCGRSRKLPQKLSALLTQETRQPSVCVDCGVVSAMPSVLSWSSRPFSVR
ncbi:unnamed protein product [Pylaiella littoralis]